MIVAFSETGITEGKLGGGWVARAGDAEWEMPLL